MSTATTQTDHEGRSRQYADTPLTITPPSVLDGLGEFQPEERPRVAVEDLWPESVSLEPDQREFATWSRSFSHRCRWAWIWPFTFGAAVGATTVFLLTEGTLQMLWANAPISSTRVPFVLHAAPAIRSPTRSALVKSVDLPRPKHVGEH